MLTRTPALKTLAALILTAALALILYAAIPAGAQTTPTDYDSDNDNLIEITTLDQLNAIRYDLDGNGTPTSTATTTYYAAFPNPVTTTTMGCQSACTGYELNANLDFDSDNSGSVTTTDPYPNWTPIAAASSTTGYAAIFDGNGRTIENLTITNSNSNSGLFAQINAGGAIRNLAIIEPSIRSNGLNIGALAGLIANGASINAVSVQDGSVASTHTGQNILNTGGLVGTSDGDIRASYSTASVSADDAALASVGGLVALIQGYGRIVASYAVGPVSATSSNTYIGGLAGEAKNPTTFIFDSYCDTTVHSTTTSCIGEQNTGAAVAADGKTTAQLQSPTGYTGIYQNWNEDLDDDHIPDHPWNFGTTTTYPTLNTPSQRQQAQQQATPVATVDYDTDNDNLIEITTLDQLNALRYDLDGNGLSFLRALYISAFPNASRNPQATTTVMGCPQTCAGYELDANLNFTSGTSTPYPNWDPIGNYTRPYQAEFNGNGYTISNLYVSSTGPSAGLFSHLGPNSVIRDLGLINPEVSVHVDTSGGVNATGNVGALAGASQGDIITTYSRDGRITGRGNIRPSAVYETNVINAGGLVGLLNRGTIRASYSTTSVNVPAACHTNAGGLIGRISPSGTTTASYAAGRVTSTRCLGRDHYLGGFVGDTPPTVTLSNNYCDTTVNIGGCIGRAATGSGASVVGKTTAELQSPTSYTGIYAQWNLNLDADPGDDNPWNFGSTTTYPTLNTPAQRYVPPPPAPPPPPDRDGDNLIEIATLDQLNAIRWDLDGDGNPTSTATTSYYAAFAGSSTTSTASCAPNCIGYELTANLNFDADNSGQVTSTDPYPNWTPIGLARSQSIDPNVIGYTAQFNGNGHTISNLTINKITPTNNIYNGDHRTGLFRSLGAGGRVQDLGIINPNVRAINAGGAGTEIVGALAGTAGRLSSISAVYVHNGSVTVPSGGNVGGLVGSTQSVITAAYSTASVDAGTTTPSNVGGLAGSQSDVSGNFHGVGRSRIIASYAAGPVSGTGTIGGLLGRNGSNDAPQLAGIYCDTTIAGAPADCIGLLPPPPNLQFNRVTYASAAVASQTTAQLQTPAAYAGTIYDYWNVDVTGDGFPDDPWNFGASTDYPTLKTPAQRLANPVTDYDRDNNGLIEINTLHQLNAVRYDVDGDGLPSIYEGRGVSHYAGAFPNGNMAAPTSTRMGCIAGCSGYELTANLDFDADNNGIVTTTDPYPDWISIGATPDFTAQFNGRGHTISNLTSHNGYGLFYRLRGAVVRDLGIINPNVNAVPQFFTGALAKEIYPGSAVIAVSVQGGSITIQEPPSDGGHSHGPPERDDNRWAGGLAALMRGGVIRASYSTASINVSTDEDIFIGGLIGEQRSGSIIASYAAGPMSVAGDNTVTGGFIGHIASTSSQITDSYCDRTVSGLTACIGAQTSTAAVTVEAKTTPQLQTPDGYTGIYQNWNLDLDLPPDGETDDPWNFGRANQYPTLNPPPGGAAPPPPAADDPGPGGAGGGDTAPPPAPPSAIVTAVEAVETYDAESAHPEIYSNPQYQMTVACQTHDPDPETGNPTSATLTFNLGTYDGPILLTLSIWRHQRYMAYETQDIPLPTLERTGQTATVRVDTNPAETRFRLDGRRYSLPHNLIMGYADCHTDDP